MISIETLKNAIYVGNHFREFYMEALAAFWLFSTVLLLLILHRLTWIHDHVIEPILLIFGGLILAKIFVATLGVPPFFHGHLFFVYMLPPIALEAGYNLQQKAIRKNLGTIIIFSVFGTFLNIFINSVVLIMLQSRYNVFTIEVDEILIVIYAAILSMSAADCSVPVLNKMHVHESIIQMCITESLLADPIVITVFMAIKSLVQQFHEDELGEQLYYLVFDLAADIIKALLFGFVAGITISFITRFSGQIPEIEPLLVFSFCYLTLIIAESLAIDGFLVLLVCAIVMKPYINMNMARKSRITVSNTLKGLSLGSYSLMYVFVGVEIVEFEFHSYGLPLVSIFVPLATRFLVTFVLLSICNRYRRVKLLCSDKFILAYGGIKSPISYTLVYILCEYRMDMRPVLIPGVLCIMLCTILIQGSTLKPILHCLKLSSTEPHHTIAYSVNERIMEMAIEGIDDMLGNSSNIWFRNFSKRATTKFLDVLLVKKEKRQLRELIAHKTLDEETIFNAIKKSRMQDQNSQTHDDFDDDLLDYW